MSETRNRILCIPNQAMYTTYTRCCRVLKCGAKASFKVHRLVTVFFTRLPWEIKSRSNFTLSSNFYQQMKQCFANWAPSDVNGARGLELMPIVVPNRVSSEDFKKRRSVAAPYGNNCGGSESDQFWLGDANGYVVREKRAFRMTTKKANLTVEFTPGSDIANETVEKRRFLREEYMQRIKAAAGHVGLLITLMLYTVIGGLVFRHIELPAEQARLESLRANLRTSRRLFVDYISNNTDVSNLHTLVSVKLRDYEEAVQEAAQGGLLISFVADTIDQEDRGPAELPPIPTERWSVLQAVFFASTVLTTIGYGNVVPSTGWGRIFCIFFAFVGIPLTLTVIADWGKLFAAAVVKVGLTVRSKLPFRCTFSCLPTNLAGRRSLGALAAIALLFLYLACGAGMFMLWEDDWDFFDGFYFCFVTMTTIGFGDLVPKKPKYTLLCTLYILVGLALTSTIIELVRLQYTQSWRRLQRLSGPLTEAIRRLGEQAGGDMSALHSDLRKVLTVISMPRIKWSASFNRADSKDQDWEDAVEVVLRDIAANNAQSNRKPIVQIVIYESSV